MGMDILLDYTFMLKFESTLNYRNNSIRVFAFRPKKYVFIILVFGKQRVTSTTTSPRR